MTGEEHRERHKTLHQHLDELIADFLTYAPGRPLPSRTTLLDLMGWSHKQAQEPDHPVREGVPLEP